MQVQGLKDTPTRSVDELINMVQDISGDKTLECKQFSISLILLRILACIIFYF